MGAVLALTWAPVAWIPFLAAGFVLGTQRVDGEWIDERVAAGLRWRIRLRRGPSPPGEPPERVGRGVVRLPGRCLVAGLAAGGIPVAYLARPDAERIFSAYRDVLRSCELPVRLWIGRAPLGVRPLPRAPGPSSAAASAARAGYGELLHLLTRRRQRREVRWVVMADDGGEGFEQLARNLDRMTALLRSLDVPARRLSETELRALANLPGAEGPR